MPAQRIAITIPPSSLRKLDEMVKKLGKSRSKFIVETLEDRLMALEDDEITRNYNYICDDPEVSDYDQQLAEDMLKMASVQEPEEKW
ncbi:MAG: ribbon-helix-helix protein, CopG family [Desulfatiglandales bacterium]